MQAASVQTSQTGLPMMRPMFMAFPGDPATQHLDRQYMLGDDLLVAPVFTETGDVSFYLPKGTWTSLLTRERVEGGRWVREVHGFDSLPLYVREGAVIPRGTRDDRPDYDFLTEVALHVYPGAEGSREITLHASNGESDTVTVTVDGAEAKATGASGRQYPVVVI